MSLVRLISPGLLVVLLASGALAKQPSPHAFAAKRTYSIKQAIAGKFSQVTGIKGVQNKHVLISTLQPLYVSSGPHAAHGTPPKYDTRTVDFKVQLPKYTYLGRTVSHTRLTNPGTTRLSHYALTLRQRVNNPTRAPTRSNRSPARARQRSSRR